MISPVFRIIERSRRIGTVGIAVLTQRGILGNWEWIKEATFKTIDATKGTIDILAADHHNAACSAFEGIHCLERVLFTVQNHMQDHLGGEAAEFLDSLRGKVDRQ